MCSSDLDFFGNNVNMGRHCVFLTWCLFLCRRDAGEGDAVWSAASSGAGASGEKGVSFDGRLWVVSAALDDCKG